MAYQVERLRRFIAANPALADIPFGFVRGRPVSPREALAMLVRGEAVAEVAAAIAAAGLNLSEEWELAEDYYRRLLALPEPRPKIYVIAYGELVGQDMTLEEALMHIRLKDAKGRALMRSYKGLRREIARRMR